MHNLPFYPDDDSPILDMNSIFSEYLDYFLSKKEDIDDSIKISLIKAIIKRITRESNNFRMRPYNFFRILKLCSKFSVEVKNVDCIEITKKSKYKLNPDYYLNDDEIDKLICPRRKGKLIGLIVGIFLKADTVHLMKLIKSKIGPDVCRSLLDLLNTGELKLDDLHFSKLEDLTIFQKILLSISKTKKEIQYAISISKGFLLSLTFIKDNINLLLPMDSYLFPIKLDSIGDKNTAALYSLE